MTSQLFRKMIKLLKRFAVEWSLVGTGEWQDCLLELHEIRSEKVLTVAASANTCPTAVPLLFLINKCSWRTAGDLGFLIKVTLCLLFFLFPTGSVVRRMNVKQPSASRRIRALALHWGWRNRKKKRAQENDDVVKPDWEKESPICLSHCCCIPVTRC